MRQWCPSSRSILPSAASKTVTLADSPFHLDPQIPLPLEPEGPIASDSTAPGDMSTQPRLEIISPDSCPENQACSELHIARTGEDRFSLGSLSESVTTQTLPSECPIRKRPPEPHAPTVTGLLPSKGRCDAPSPIRIRRSPQRGLPSPSSTPLSPCRPKCQARSGNVHCS